MSEKSYSYRLAPCPSYDIDGMQGWLAQMAQKGLHLSSDGFFAGFAIFEKGTSYFTTAIKEHITFRGSSSLPFVVFKGFF